MNNMEMGWQQGQVARRRKSERDALDRLLARRGNAERARMDAVLQAASAMNPAMAQTLARIAEDRALIARRAGLVAVAGGFAVVAAVAAMSMGLAPVASPISHILLAGLSLTMFALVGHAGRPAVVQQAAFWAIPSLLLMAEPAASGVGAGLVGLGWAAIGARGWLMEAARRLDLEEMELALAARGRDDSVARMRLKVAAAI